MGVRRGEQRTTPLTLTATGTALFFPALAALVTAAVALDALDLATTALVHHAALHRWRHPQRPECHL